MLFRSPKGFSRTRLASKGEDAVNVGLAALRSVEGGAEVNGSALEGGGGGEGREGDDGEGGELHFCGVGGFGGWFRSCFGWSLVGD